VINQSIKTGEPGTLRSLVTILVKHRSLILEMARREVSDRYAGQIIGTVWAVGHPLFVIGLYIFVFNVVFRQKVGGTLEMPLDYTAYILSGLVAWLAMQECLIKSCTLITSNSSLVKQTVFPLEVLVLKSNLVSLFPMLLSLSILVIYVGITQGGVHPTYALLPLLLMIQFFGMLGLSFLLAPLGAYFRDLKDVVQLFATAGIYLMPVFYLPSWTPELFRPLLNINPFSHLIWCYQDLLYFGRFDHPWAWLSVVLFNAVLFFFGYSVFRKLKPGLGNLL
jgi:lipopolysaccharide transport system permease protein